MKIVLAVFSVCIGFTLFGQSLSDWTDLGDRAMSENDPYGALRYYRQAMDIDSMKGRLIYRMAEAYRGVQNYPKAAYYYDKIYRRDRGLVFKDVGMKLAEMQMQAGHYDEAKTTWRRVRKEHQDRPGSYEYQKAIQSMRSCDLAKAWSKQVSAFELTPASSPVNSGDSEFAGLWLDDGSLRFTSLRGSYDEQGRLESEAYFIKTYQADSSLREVIPVIPMMDTIPANFGNYARSVDGKEALVIVNDRGRKEIFLKSKESWLKVLPLNEGDSANYTHPCFARFPDKDWLIFASDRPDGFGNYDLWFMPLDKSGPPENLGKEINTPGNEITPFFREDEATLYFASDWHHGFGGYDLFKSPYFEASFSFPENLRRPFNSGTNDLYYSFNATQRKGSVTSNRVGPDAYGGCCNNLFFFEEEDVSASDTLPEITTLEELNQYLPVTLYFHNDEPDPRTRKSTTEQDYPETYRAYIRLLPTYRAEYRKGLEESEGDRAEEEMDAFFLNEVDRGMEHLALFTELLRRELDEGSRIELTVKGYASPLAATDYNVNLTRRRIHSLENYLKNYDRGSLRPYLEENAENGGVLRLSKIPFGEYTADQFVSDNPNESNAIYGISAAKERKIEIVSVSRAPSDTGLARVRFDSELVDLGSVLRSHRIGFSFPFEVEGEEVFRVDSVSVPSSVELDRKGTYAPGDRKFEGRLYTGEEQGKRNLVIEVYGNIPGGRKELNITFETQ
jgi:tetratricopeptide (TPR) repeat protein